MGPGGPCAPLTSLAYGIQKPCSGEELQGTPLKQTQQGRMQVQTNAECRYRPIIYLLLLC